MATAAEGVDAMKGRVIPYAADELDFIEDTSAFPRRLAHAAFCALFGRTDVSLTNYKALCKRKGWLTGRTGCFPKGHVPANKGKKMPFNANSARTRFKKGNGTGRANENYKPIGTERLSKEGYVQRKIHDGLPLQSRWRSVHVINWEALNGPVPAGHCLKSLDGDKANTDPANWTCIPRAMLPRLSGRHSVAYDTAPAALKPAIMAAARLDHAAREAKRPEPARKETHL